MAGKCDIFGLAEVSRFNERLVLYFLINLFSWLLHLNFVPPLCSGHSMLLNLAHVPLRPNEHS